MTSDTRPNRSRSSSSSAANRPHWRICKAPGMIQPGMSAIGNALRRTAARNHVVFHYH